MNLCLRILGILCAVAGLSRPAFCQTTVTLSASKDNTLYEDANGDTSNGAGDYFFSGKNATTGGNKLRRGVIAFDLSSIPAGSTITGVTLTLHMSQTSAGAQNVGVHKLSANWGEGTSDAPGNEGQGAPATTNDATWIHKFFNTQLWTSAGGDFTATASATTSVSGIGFYSWSSATMITDVQGWVNSSATNFGWLVKHANESPSHTAKRFDSRTHPTTSNRPTLQVTYCPPAKIVINEVDYDQPGTDSSEFIELFNAGTCAENLDPYEVQLVNGNGGGATVYQTINLPNVSLNPGDWYVICANGGKTPNCDLDVLPNVELIENGAPDAIGLFKTGVLQDAVSYEGNSGVPFVEGSGVGLIDNGVSPQVGISRTPDGDDTNVNNVDFQNSCITPGFSNVSTNSNCAVTANAGPDKTTCQGTATQIGGSPTGSNGIPPYTYVWMPPTGLSNPNVANPNANPTSTTTYVVKVTDQAGSVDRDTMVLTVNPLPPVSVSANPQQICLGDTSTLTANGALTYTWAPPATLSSSSGNPVLAFPTINTIYTVTGTDANGCKNNATVGVQVMPLPNVNAGADQAICPGDSAQLGASGAVSYVWSPSTGLSCTTCASPKAAPPANQTYTVIGTAANGCTDDDQVTVSYLPTPNVVASNNVAICAGACTTLTATGAISYLWAPPTGLSCTTCQSPNACPSVTTTYTVTGTNASGCEGTDEVTVTVNQLPTVSAGTDKTICAGLSTVIGGSPTASNGSPPYSISWTPAGTLDNASAANPTATPASTTTYTVTVTDANSCQASDNVLVTVLPVPNVDAGSNHTICPGACAQLQATGAVSYVWDANPTLSCTTCSNPVACPLSGTTWYYVTGTGANGCTKRDSVSVTVSSTLNVIVNPPAPSICAGSSLQLAASGASSYAWSPGTGLSCANCPDPVANPGSTTTYTVVGSSGSCSDTATVTVTVHQNPVANAGPDKGVCPGFSTTIGGNPAASNGSPPYTFAWLPGGITAPNPTVTPTATTCYTLTVTDSQGCQDTDEACVTVFGLPPTNAGPSQEICFGDTAQLTGSGAQQFSWAPAGSLSCSTCSSPLAFPFSTTVYTLTGTSGNGCQRTDTVTVIVNPFPNVVATATPDEICLGESSMLSASGASTYVWTPGTGGLVSPSVTTTYTVVGTDANGCSHSDDVTVTVHALPVVNAGSDVTINQGGSTQLNASGALTYSWSPTTGLSDPNIADPIASPDSSMCYTVTGTDANGCSDADEVCVTVLVGIDDPGVLNWNVNPNPTDGFVRIAGTLEAHEAVIEVRNGLGLVVIAPTQIQGGNFSVEFDLSNHSAGWYVVVLRADGNVTRSQLLRQ